MEISSTYFNVLGKCNKKKVQQITALTGKYNDLKYKTL